MITISPYTNFPVNGNAKFHTTDCTTTVPGGGWQGADLHIGRVDHFMKTSIKSIVDACVRQVVKREGMKGLHTIEIVYHSEELDGEDLKYGPKQKLVVTADVA